MKKENKYIIYKAENTENNQVYIGATTSSVHNRKLDHIRKAKRGENGKFYEAISTYRADAFSWQQVDTASSTDELAQKEKEYIYKYDSINQGYNSDEGGGFKKTVYQYDVIDGSLISTYKSLTDAGNAVNATKQSISAACLSVNKIYENYYWSYTFQNPFTPEVDKRLKQVLQLDIEGKLLRSFKSVAEASRITGVYKGCIAKSCRGERKTAGGYHWKYSD